MIVNLGMLVHTYDRSTQVAMAVGFKATLDYIMSIENPHL